jgi:hypothetical protein
MGLLNLTLREETPRCNSILTRSSLRRLGIFWSNVSNGLAGLWQGRLMPQA